MRSKDGKPDDPLSGVHITIDDRTHSGEEQKTWEFTIAVSSRLSQSNISAPPDWRKDGLTSTIMGLHHICALKERTHGRAAETELDRL